MATITWAGTVNGNFTTAADWTGGVVPGASDFAHIDAIGRGFYTVSSSGTVTVEDLHTGSNATLNITAGSFTATDGTGGSGIGVDPGANDGTIDVASGAVLEAGGAFVNDGFVNLTAASGSVSRLEVSTSNMVLSGTGVVSLAASGQIVGATAASILFNDGVIKGGGGLGNASLTFENQSGGVVDGTTGMSLDTEGETLINQGLIEATNPGSGEVTGLTIVFTTVNNAGGTISAGNDMLLGLESADIIGGALESAGNGFITTEDNGVVLDGVTNSGTIQIINTITLEGAIDNSGVIFIRDGFTETISLAANTTLSGGGHITLSAEATNAIVGASSGLTLTNVDNTISGGGLIGGGELAVDNEAGGVIDGTGPQSLAINTTGGVTNAGLIESINGALYLEGDNINGAGGTISAGAGGAVFLESNSISGGNVTVAATGTLAAVSGVNSITLTTGDKMTVANALFAENTATLTISGATISASGADIAAGPGATLAFDASRVLAGAKGDTIGVGAKGALDINNASLVQLEGATSNAGVIAITAGANGTELEILSKGATLSGGGTVAMSGTAARIIGATAASVLVNIDNTISGFGNVGVNKLTLINEADGVIDASGGGTLTVETKNEALTNSGLMQATGGGTLSLVDTDVSQGSTGIIQAGAGSKVLLNDASVTGGTVESAGTGVLEVNGGGGTLNGSTAAVDVAGELRLINGTNLTLQGAIDGTGKIAVMGTSKSTDLLIGAAGATLSGGGTVSLGNSTFNILDGASASSLLTNVSDTIAGAGLLGDGKMELTNGAGGTIIANLTKALVVNLGASTLVSNGEIENTSTGGLTIEGALTNGGTLNVTKGVLAVDGAVNGAGTVRVSGGTADFASTFTENVTFTATAGSVLELGQSQTYTGKISGFSRTGASTLDLTDITFGGGTTAKFSGTTASGVLTVTDGTHTSKITLVGNYTKSTFTTASDGHGGTKVTDPTAAPGATPASPTPTWRIGPEPVVLVTAMAAFGQASAGGGAAHLGDLSKPPLTTLVSPVAA